MRLNYIDNIDCLEGMKSIPDGSVDMILCDLPYGTTACKWDIRLPLDKLWGQYERVIKPDGAIVLFGSEPFSTLLRHSNFKWYRYDWIWKKSKVTLFQHANKMPLKDHENISVFYRSQPTYNPQGLQPANIAVKRASAGRTFGDRWNSQNCYTRKFTNYPRRILEFNSEGKTVHPTQKPIALLEYLVKTYTNEGDVVLDNCMGSGSTAVACVRTRRNFIGFELDEKYHAIALQRVVEALDEILKE